MRKRNPSNLPLSGEAKSNANAPYLSYEKNLVSRAREFRKEETPAERKIWNEILRDRNIIGYKFTRQKPLDHFIADFYCAHLLLVVEIDGDVHAYTEARDLERTQILEEKYNLKVVRYANSEVLKNIDSVYQDLKKIIKLRAQYLKL